MVQWLRAITFSQHSIISFKLWYTQRGQFTYYLHKQYKFYIDTQYIHKNHQEKQAISIKYTLYIFFTVADYCTVFFEMTETHMQLILCLLTY